MTQHKVALFGTFDVDNYGDCLFPLIVEQQLRKRLPDVSVFPFSPTKRTPEISNYDRVYSISEINDVFENNSPGFIIGGGNLLTTSHSMNVYPQIRHLLYPFSIKCWLLPAMIASAWNSPMIINGIGLGPFDERFADLTKKFLQRACIRAVRDAYTHEYLNEFEVESEVVPDSGFLVPELRTDVEWMRINQNLRFRWSLPSRYMIVHTSLSMLGHREKSFIDNIARLFKTTGLPVVLIPISHQLNDLVALKIMHKSFVLRGVEPVVINDRLSTIETSSLLAGSDLYVGTSLHGAVVTLAFGKPVVSVTHAEKSKSYGVLSTVGMEDYCIWELDRITEKALNVLNSKTLINIRNNLDSALSSLRDHYDGIAKALDAGREPFRARRPTLSWKSGELFCDTLSPDLQNLREICLDSLPIKRRIWMLIQSILYRNRSMHEIYEYIKCRR